MVIVGLIILLLGYLTGSAFLWSLGGLVLIIGLILMLLGAVGHAVGGRRHYF